MGHWTETLFREQADLWARTFEDRFGPADEQVEQLLALLADEHGIDPGTSLDVACGVGRHVLALADRGLDAEGLDFSEPFLERARKRARDRDLDERTAFRHMDMRDLDEIEGSYDLVTSFWNSLGYYDRATDERLFADVHRLLAPGGAFAVELTNKDCFLANFEESRVSEGDADLVAERWEYDPATGRACATMDWFDEADGGYEHVDTIEFENRIYAPPVLRTMCERAGFDDVALYGGFEGDDLTLEAPRVVAVAEK